MSTSVTIDRPGVSDVAAAMKRVEKVLGGAGYTVAARGFAELQLVRSSGPVRAVVQFSAERVRYVFSPAAPGVVLPAQEELEKHIGGATDAPVIGAPPPMASSGQRCGICATVIPVGATECPLCGMPTK